MKQGEKIDMLEQQRVIKVSRTSYYIRPHILLTPYIAHYTIMQPSIKGGPQEKKREQLYTEVHIIPDASGCIVLEYDGYKLSSYFWSPTTKTTIVTNDINEKPLRVFIEFLPGGAKHFGGLDQVDEADSKLPLDLIDKEMARRLEELLIPPCHLEQMILELDKILLTYFSEADKRLTKLLPHIKTMTGVLSVQDLAEQTFYSTRQLSRLFHDGMCMTTKNYLRLLRINQSVELIKRTDIELAQLGQQMGYFDQSHFIHDFKAVCGVNPGTYRKHKKLFYNEPFKL